MAVQEVLDFQQPLALLALLAFQAVLDCQEVPQVLVDLAAFAAPLDLLDLLGLLARRLAQARACPLALLLVLMAVA